MAVDTVPMRRPWLLDLFCGAGGAAMGFSRTGFEIIGVDNKPQPHYPFPFVQADAVAYAAANLDQFDAVHASPPCQAYSDLALQSKLTYPQLIEPTRKVLEDSGVPYVIENVETAPLLNCVVLCGTQFGIRVLRHRKFEAGNGLTLVDLPHMRRHPLVYTRDKRKAQYGKLDEMTSPVMVNGGGNCTIAAARDAMGIGWMTKDELNEAVPPVYTEWVGRQLYAYVAAQG